MTPERPRARRQVFLEDRALGLAAERAAALRYDLHCALSRCGPHRSVTALQVTVGQLSSSSHCVSTLGKIMSTAVSTPPVLA